MGRWTAGAVVKNGTDGAPLRTHVSISPSPEPADWPPLVRVFSLDGLTIYVYLTRQLVIYALDAANLRKRERYFWPDSRGSKETLFDCSTALLKTVTDSRGHIVPPPPNQNPCYSRRINTNQSRERTSQTLARCHWRTCIRPRVLLRGYASAPVQTNQRYFHATRQAP